MGGRVSDGHTEYGLHRKVSVSGCAFYYPAPCFVLVNLLAILFDLFDFILYVSSTIFHFNRDGLSCVEPLLS